MRILAIQFSDAFNSKTFQTENDVEMGHDSFNDQ